jgi:uncharacterized protein YbbC (DUF1343 family)
VLTGLDRALRDGLRLPGRGRAGLLCNATTVSGAWQPSAEALAAVEGVALQRIFSPQHGFAAEKQDNMVASGNGVHPRLDLPIVSLYGEKLAPDPADFNGLDVILIDLQDVGTRVYTFLISALYMIRAALPLGIPVYVLDRPNPIGGRREGPLLEDRLRSFVGLVDVPLRHGLTAGEYCRYGAWRLGVLDERDAQASVTGRVPDGGLQIVALEGWRRTQYYDQTDLPWVAPSPNLPTLETALVYPGQVILEGTELSEGRGTTRPFELWGAPYLDPPGLLAGLSRAGLLQEPAGGVAAGGDEGLLAGVLLREVAFEPTFNKHAGRLVRGFQIHCLDRAKIRPVAMTVALLAAVRACHPEFLWRQTPYEYERERPAVDLICGTPRVREAIDAGAGVAELAASWEAPLAAFGARVAPFLIYGD